MVIFHGYVSLPEGNLCHSHLAMKQLQMNFQKTETNLEEMEMFSPLKSGGIWHIFVTFSNSQLPGILLQTETLELFFVYRRMGYQRLAITCVRKGTWFTVNIFRLCFRVLILEKYKKQFLVCKCLGFVQGSGDSHIHFHITVCIYIYVVSVIVDIC